MSIQKSTHKAHCQVCGRIQMVMNGGNDNGHIAKHGYKVAGFGFFNGVCEGAVHLPLEQERTVTDSIIVRLGEYAATMDKRAFELRAGTVTPAIIETNEAARDDNGRIQRDRMGNRILKVIAFDQGDVYQKADAVRMATFNAEQNARHARSHSKMLVDLIARVHGQPLQSVVKVERVAPVVPTVDVKAATVSGTYPTKQSRQDALQNLNRQYEKAHKKIQQMYLDSRDELAYEQRDEAQDLVYYGPMYLNHWRPKHSAACLKHFPQCAELVAEIEDLVKAREAVKNA